VVTESRASIRKAAWFCVKSVPYWALVRSRCSCQARFSLLSAQTAAYRIPAGVRYCSMSSGSRPAAFCCWNQAVNAALVRSCCIAEASFSTFCTHTAAYRRWPPIW
jgi:hypothetical protein